MSENYYTRRITVGFYLFPLLTYVQKCIPILFQLQFAQQTNEDVILFLVMNNSYDKLKYFTLFALSYKLKPVLPGEVAKGDRMKLSNFARSQGVLFRHEVHGIKFTYSIYANAKRVFMFPGK